MKRVIEWTIRMEQEFPDDWGDDQMDFRYNGSSYCNTNLLDDLNREVDALGKERDCLCYRSKVKVLPLGATLDIDDNPENQ